MNWALMENAILGPWIHVGSTIRYLATASVEDVLTVRAKVTGNYDRKGHKFVELDGVIVANGKTSSRIASTWRFISLAKRWRRKDSEVAREFLGLLLSQIVRPISPCDHLE